VYVADVWNSRVQVFPPIPQDGTASAPDTALLPIVTWNVPGWYANSYDDLSIATGADSTVYTVVPVRNMAIAASQRGEIGVRWGGVGDHEAALNLPSGIAVGPAGDVYVVDRDRARVLRFTVPAVRYESETAPE
jgi:hypothetical protein